MFKKKKKTEEDASREAVETPTEIAENGASEKKSLIKRIFSLKFLILIFLILLVLGGGGGAGWYFFLRDTPSDAGDGEPGVEQVDEAAEAGDDSEPLPPPEPDFPEVVDLEPFEEVKIQESGNLNHLTVALSIELVDPELRETFEEALTLVRQTLESDIKQRSWMTLRAPEGKLRMKYAMIEKLNNALPSSMVKNIYIKTLIFQL